MKVFIERNLKLFFRDRLAVFFSLMSVFIIIGLYALFLGDVWMNDSMKELKYAQALMNSWLVSGLLTVTSITTTMGAFGIMIDDKVQKINKDFDSSPIKRSSITGGYIGSSFFIGVIMSLVMAVVAEIYIVHSGGEWLTPMACIKVFLLILLTTLTNTSLVCFVVSFFKSHSAFSTASSILGTLIGFLTGIYLPIGTLPESVQTVIKAFPVSHGASLFRQVLMEIPMRNSFGGIPSIYLEEFKEYLGVSFRFGGYEVTPTTSVVILLCTAIVFYSLSLFNILRRNR
ncbi:ABC transporter permease [Lacrimispora sphenoides]|uniref:Multidrug/hemolysin transport system permease protein n=1 Tax=Lacrimispora sphenoides JCM 1415 TaxID=1297793 RepID=A0ABY1CBP1_9FIRM|nr:ABC transporter permease [Lacrimispora sphenoides]SET87510.1 multidrug/hemolysin transport system permease protein [[Clostridium] sphenoides JCM 1415]SUY51968.1 ABC transporter [Lacrimispora sphenoides]